MKLKWKKDGRGVWEAGPLTVYEYAGHWYMTMWGNTDACSPFTTARAAKAYCQRMFDEMVANTKGKK